MTRMKQMMAGSAALIAISFLMSAPASAFGWTHYDRDSASDPFAYKYEHRGYYPYYGSDYWRPAHKVRRRRFRFVQPRYHKSWGLYKRHIHKHHHGHPHGTVEPHTHRRHHW